MGLLFQILLIFFLIALNGFFVASEFSLVASRKTRIAELIKKRNKTAKKVEAAQNNIGNFISATQLGITFSSLALGWIGEPVLAQFFNSKLLFVPTKIAFITSHSISFLIAFILITFLHIVLGELVPKSIALQKAEAVSLVTITPLTIFAVLFNPFIALLNKTGQLILTAIGFSGAQEQIVHSEEEIKMILSQSSQSGAIEPKEAEMVYNVFRLADIPVKQIMVPRTDVIALNVASQLKDVMKTVTHNPHSRFPVFEHSIDNIIGFVHVKDIYKAFLEKQEDKSLSELKIIRKIIAVPETKRIDDVLLDMQKKRIHLAVVNDEYGGTEGIITLEDILESLVGEIQDEFDKPLKEIERQKDGSYLIDGLTPIDTVQSKFNLPLRGQGYATIGGLVFGLLGREPKIGDQIQIGTIIFEIFELRGKRIKTIGLRKVPKQKIR